MRTCNKPIGNWEWTSVVIQSLNASCTVSVSTKASMTSVQNGRDK